MVISSAGNNQWRNHPDNFIPLCKLQIITITFIFFRNCRLTVNKHENTCTAKLATPPAVTYFFLQISRLGEAAFYQTKFARGRNFPLSISSQAEKKNNDKFFSARKIPSSRKQPLIGAINIFRRHVFLLPARPPSLRIVGVTISVTKPEK